MNIKALLLLCAVTLFPAIPQANVVISSTRIIYPGAAREVTATIDNVGKQPALVQTWLDAGNLKSTPEQTQVPFVLLPPMFRLDPGQQQNLRITFIGDHSLPQDRESVFWLNMLDIPPKPRADVQNYLQFSLRSRFKLFYRPEGLKADPEQAPEQLQWQLATNKQSLLVHNPSPYHVTITKVIAGSQTLEGKMIAPLTRESFPLPKAIQDDETLLFKIINDYGAETQHRARVGQ